MRDLHRKIETAKRLLIKQMEINGKIHTFASLDKDFDLSADTLMSLFEDDLIKLNHCFLQQGYINEYKQKGRELEAKLHKIRVASMTAVSGHFNTESTHNPFMDKYCGLGKGLYNKLVDKPQIELDALSIQALIKNDISKKFISFSVEFSPQKIQEFLDKKIDSFIKDDLDLTEKISGSILNLDYFPSNIHKAQRFLSYEKQKEDFSIGIAKQISQGYPLNNLKIDYTQIWQKNIILQVNFLETALGMEKEGLIEIKDIIERMPKNPVVITSDLFWHYPIIIQIKVLQNFNQYYELVYRKYNPAQISQAPQEKKQEKDLAQNHKEPQKENNFNYNDASLIFNGQVYKPTEEIRKKFIRELWLKKQVKDKKGVVTQNGERKREAEIAVLSGFSKGEQEFNFAEYKHNFRETLKQLNRIFKSKKFPLTIDSNREGILLIQTMD